MKAIARVYEKLDNLTLIDDSKLYLESHEKTLQIASEAGQQSDLAFAHLNMGASYLSLHKYNDSENHLQIALDFFKTLNNLNGLIACYKLLGQLQLKQKDNQSAVNYLNRALEIGKKLKSKRNWIADALVKVKSPRLERKPIRFAFYPGCSKAKPLEPRLPCGSKTAMPIPLNTS